MSKLQAPDLTLLELLEEVEVMLNRLPNQRYRNQHGFMRSTYDLVEHVSRQRLHEYQRISRQMAVTCAELVNKVAKERK